MSAYLIELLLGFSVAWAGLLWLWKNEADVVADRDPLAQRLDAKAAFGSLWAMTVLTVTASITFNLAVLWACFASYLALMVFLARRMPDLSPIPTDQFEEPPPVLWTRCRASAIASLICVTFGCVVLITLSGKWQLREISAALHSVLHPASVGINGPSLRLLAVRVAMVAIFTGTGIATFTSPLHYPSFEAISQWPAAVAGGWTTASRLLGMLFVWRMVQTVYSGMESTLVCVMLAFGLLSLAQGTMSLWQDCSLRGFVARWLVLQSGLSWILLAGEVVKPIRSGNAALNFGAGFDGLVAAWAAASLSMLLLFVVEQAVMPTRNRIESLSQIVSFRPRHLLTTQCLKIGLLSLTVLPPLPQFWLCLALILNAIAPGSPQLEQARLMPHPAVVVGLIAGVLSLTVVTVRVLTLLAASRTQLEKRDSVSEPFSEQAVVRWMAVALCAVLIVAGLFPATWMSP